MLSILLCYCWPSVCLLWKKCLFRSSTHFLTRFFLLLSSNGSLYSLHNGPLTKRSFVHISASVWLVFILFTVSLAEQKFLILMKSSFFLSWIVVFVLCLKSHHHSQGHLGYLLGVFEVCNLQLGL